MDITGAKCMIENSNLQFTNATQLNDPFDCHPRLIDYSKISKHNHQGGIPDEWWKTKRENDALNKRNSTWLCSLSKVNDSILMWSHYCYNHKGVCIGLDLDKVMESVPPMFDVMYIKPLVLDVQYKDIIERPNAYRDTKICFVINGRQKQKTGNTNRRLDWLYQIPVVGMQLLPLRKPNIQRRSGTGARFIIICH